MAEWVRRCAWAGGLIGAIALFNSLLVDTPANAETCLSPFVKRLDRPEKFLYVFCVDADAKDHDFLAVIDVDVDSPRYGKLIYKLNTHTDWVRTVDYSPDGQILASAGNDRQIIFWDAASGAKLSVFTAQHAAIAAVRFSHNGKWLAVVGFEIELVPVIGRAGIGHAHHHAADHAIGNAADRAAHAELDGSWIFEAHRRGSLGVK